MRKATSSNATNASTALRWLPPASSEAAETRDRTGAALQKSCLPFLAGWLHTLHSVWLVFSTHQACGVAPSFSLLAETGTIASDTQHFPPTTLQPATSFRTCLEFFSYQRHIHKTRSLMMYYLSSLMMYYLCNHKVSLGST